MDKAVYIKNVYHLYHLAGRILSREGKFLKVPFDGFLDEDPVFNSPKLLQMLMDYGGTEHTSGMTTGIGIMCFMTWEIMLFGEYEHGYYS